MFIDFYNVFKVLIKIVLITIWKLKNRGKGKHSRKRTANNSSKSFEFIRRFCYDCII